MTTKKNETINENEEISTYSTLESLINEIEGTNSAMEMLQLKEKILFHLKNK